MKRWHRWWTTVMTSPSLIHEDPPKKNRFLQMWQRRIGLGFIIAAYYWKEYQTFYLLRSSSICSAFCELGYSGIQTENQIILTAGWAFCSLPTLITLPDTCPRTFNSTYWNFLSSAYSVSITFDFTVLHLLYSQSLSILDSTLSVAVQTFT